MSFEGRDDLVNLSINYFEKYTHKFLNNIQTYYKCEGKYLEEECEEAYEELFSMLLTKDFNIEKGKELAKTKNFDKTCFYKALLTTYIDFSKYIASHELNPKLVVNLAYALERYDLIFCNSYYENTNTNSSINVFSANAGGFFIHENFIDTFKKVYNASERLEFLNLYNGVPIRTYGEILQVEDHSITVKLELIQILAMKEEDCAYIVQNKYIQKNIKANILSVNIVNCTVTLTNFESQYYMHALKRAYPRVHPNEFTKITLKHEDGREANGKLFDISEGGIGVVSNEDVGFKSGDILKSTIILHMPKTSESVELKLKFELVVLIVYQNAYRYCLQILPNQEDAKKIQEFAILRVEETLTDLKNQLNLYKRD